MKKLFLLLGLVVAAGAASYAICYHRAMAAVVVTPDGTDAELAWLKHEFALTPEQYGKVLALHQAYRPVCAAHCASYAAAHEHLAEMLKNQTNLSPEANAAIVEMARIQSDCHASMLKYAYDVAACMSPGQGRRYLDMIKAQILGGDPAGMSAAH